MPASVARHLARISRRRHYAAGDVIFHGGDAADTLHVIDSGRVAALITNPLGQQLIFSIMGPGDMFGELALIVSDGGRSATVRTLEATETLALTRRQFEQLRREEPEFEAHLTRVLTRHVLHLSDRLHEMLYLSVETRIRRRLLELASLYGGERPGTIIPLSQDDLAGLTGASRTTVNQVLRHDAGCGFVRLGRRRVTILDAAALRRWAGVDE